MAYQPIACHKHDYLEIACLKGYEIELYLVSGNILQGLAKTTLSHNQQEFLLIKNKKGEHKVRLDHIKKITVLTAHADFKEVLIKSHKVLRAYKASNPRRIF